MDMYFYTNIPNVAIMPKLWNTPAGVVAWHNVSMLAPSCYYQGFICESYSDSRSRDIAQEFCQELEAVYGSGMLAAYWQRLSGMSASGGSDFEIGLDDSDCSKFQQIVEGLLDKL
ncbi:MAG: hypothetical protein M1820_005171 [Bogoriella megaspora]|nr:MAG: hypothetical protein M1820_005171 [Bogoriella megaspora]